MAETLPVSKAQHRFWLEWCLDPENTAYHLCLAHELRGPFDKAAFVYATNRVVSRHEALRTAFTERGSELTAALVENAVVVSVEERVLRGTCADTARERLLDQVFRAPFDLRTAPHVRLGILERGRSHHELFVVVHHVGFDGGSVAVLQRELSECYRAALRSEEPLLEPPPLQSTPSEPAVPTPRDADRLESYAFWDQQVNGVGLRSEFPNLGSGEVVGGADDTRSHYFTLPEALLPRAESYATEASATFFEVSAAAWGSVLGRYCQQDALALSYPVSLRPRTPDGARSVGCFVNTLPLVLRGVSASPFSELTAQVRHHRRAARPHQAAPFPELVRRFRAQGRISSGLPPLNVGFAATHLRVEYMPLEGTNSHPLRPPAARALWDIHLEYESANPRQFRISGRARACPPWYLRQLAVDFMACLERGVCFPEEAPPAVLPSARHATEFSSKAVCDTAAEGLLFAWQRAVAAHRDAVAIEDSEGVLSYAELDELSNRVAGALKNRRVATGSEYEVVAFSCRPSRTLAMAALGIVKSGSVYLPLNVDDPLERAVGLLGSARASLVLADDPSRYSELLARTAGRVEVVGIHEAAAGEPLTSPPVTDANRPAYVMFTSGSTGVPKGVVVPERGILRLVLGANDLKIEPGDRVGLASNPSFDASTLELWGSLLNGATAVAIGRASLLETNLLHRTLGDAELSLLFLTTGLFHRHAAAAPGAFSGLRTLVVGGDVLSPVLTNRVLSGRDRPGCIINGYGPTENTTFTTTHVLTEALADDHAIPIGLPIAGTTCFVLDDTGSPVPPGVPGELHVGGAGLALGYLHQPELTEERFISAPLALRSVTGEGSRLYRTGDMARWDPGGRLHFMGRNDAQLKVRGFRVEPAEVERQMCRHGGVRDAVVVARRVGGDLALHGFYAAQEASSGGASEAAVREALLDALPAYMVPTGIHRRDSLPLNANGKADLRVLLQSLEETLEGADPPGSPAQPVTETERRLLAIWSRLLEREAVGVEDRFVDVGGHSLVAVALVAEVRARLGAELAVDEIFEHESVRAIGAILDARQGRPSAVLPAFPAAEPTGSQGFLPLGLAQRGHWHLLRRKKPYICFAAVRLVGDVDSALLEEAINAVTARHEAFWLEMDRKKPRQRLRTPSRVELRHVLLEPFSTRADEERALTNWAERAVQRSGFGVPTGKFALLRTGSGSAFLTLAMPHALVDGFSLELVMQEVHSAYVAQSRGEPDSTRPPTASVEQYLRWESQTVTQDYVRSARAYLEARLYGDATFKIPRASLTADIHGAVEPVPEEAFGALEVLARALGVSVESLMVYCGFLTLHAGSGQPRVRCLSAFNNRDFEESRRFVFMLAGASFTQSDIAPEASFRDAAKAFCVEYQRSLRHARIPAMTFFSMSRLLFVRKRLEHFRLSRFVSWVAAWASPQKDAGGIAYTVDLVLASLLYEAELLLGRVLRRKYVRTTGCLVNVTTALGKKPAADRAPGDLEMVPVRIPVPVPESVPGSPMLEIFRDSTGVKVLFQARYSSDRIRDYLALFQAVVASVAASPNATLGEHLVTVERQARPLRV